METLTFKLQEDNFEGPLDLLLYLVGKNKMNLYDINIMELIEQYTAAIQTMQADKLEVSSEFIDMAAHLVQMKSALLLPRSPEAERMKAELTGRLIEYSTASRWQRSWAAVRGIVHRGAPAPKTGRPGGIFPQTGSRPAGAGVVQPDGPQPAPQKAHPGAVLNRWSPRRSYRWQAVWPHAARYAERYAVPHGPAVQPAGKPQHQCGNVPGAAGIDPRRACAAG